MAEIHYSTPGNSNASKSLPSPAKKEIPKMEPVVSGKVSLKEKSKSEKLVADAQNAAKTVFDNTIMPSIKSLIFDAILNGLSMIFFPDGRKGTSSFGIPSVRSYNNSYGGYNNYYPKSNNQVKIVNTEPVFKNPVLYDIQEARLVLDAMRETIATYGFATWSTLYELCRMDTNNWQGTTKYGWVSVDATKINTFYDVNGNVAYELCMPRSSPIDNEESPF